MQNRVMNILKWNALGFRILMETSLYQLAENLASLSAEMSSTKVKLGKMAADPAAKMEEIQAMKTRAEELKQRHAILQAQYDEMTAEAKARLARQPKSPGADGTMTKKEAAGRFYQAALTGGNVRELGEMVYEQLGAIPANNADQGNGSNLLPTNLSNDLILEPAVVNPLRPYMTVTNITGLELPKLGFTVDDDSFAAKDGETAKEMKMDASGKITFGRFKMPLAAEVSETVLRGSPINVEGAVNGGLQSSQAAKELKVIFATAPSADEKHMSLYAKTGDVYDVKAVTGATLLDAIVNAFGDLEDAYQDNARCVMRRQDYFAMIRELSNGSESLYGKKPEDIIGFPVVFCSRATIPVIGDIKYLHENFDQPPLYDTDKDVKKGNRIFALTHLYDIHLRMRSAFRLAIQDDGV